MSFVKTKILVISDTHGRDLQLPPVDKVDVVIHCGDITDGSQLHEYKTSLAMLERIDAPLKLVIAGNHDWSMDKIPYLRMLREATLPGSNISKAEFEAAYGSFDAHGISDAQKIMESDEAVAAGVRFLNEGVHEFRLDNGGYLRAYASPYTPSSNGNMGFQYKPESGKSWAEFRFRFQYVGCDVLITHGPPRGILDISAEHGRIGCTDLFAAVARRRPMMHCFGHVHSGWGAKLVRWRRDAHEKPTDMTEDEFVLSKICMHLRPSHFTDIDHEGSKTVASMKSGDLARDKHVMEVDETILRDKQTLFVNAALATHEEESKQIPWLVTLKLPLA